MTDTPHTPSPSLAGVRVRGRHKSPAPSPQSSPVRDCVAIRKIVFPFFCHFERSEKSLFRPEGEICLRSLAFARDDNPKLKHCDTASDGGRLRWGVNIGMPGETNHQEPTV